MLFDSHRALSQSPLTPVSFPLNPTLPNLLLQSIDDNPLTKLCGSTLRQFKTYDTKTLFGLYFLVYRLLRVSPRYMSLNKSTCNINTPFTVASPSKSPMVRRRA